MISSIRAKNFKCHKDTKIDFCEGVNILIGDSQAGKSSFLGAFKWLWHNRPLGLRVKSHFAKAKDAVRVDALLPEAKLSLTKSRNKGCYKVNGKPFRKFGTNVPEEVTAALNLSDLNIQEQLDPYYLIISGPTEVTKAINEVTGLEQAIPAINWTANEINKRKAATKVLTEQLTQRKKDLKAYRQVDKWDRKVRKAERMSAQAKCIAEQRAELHDIIEEIEDADRAIEEQKDVDFGKCEKLIRRIAMCIEEGMAINKLFMELKQLSGEIYELNQQLDVKQVVLKGRKDEYVRKLIEYGKCPTCLHELSHKKVEELVKSV